MRKTFKADTLDSAINNAMIELSITSDKLAYEVIQEGTAGFLGIGAKPFIIEAYSKDDKEELYKAQSVNKTDKLVEQKQGVYEFRSEKRQFKKQEKMTRDPKEVFEKAKAFLKPILDEFEADIVLAYEVLEDQNTLIINLSGDKMGVIIGKHGQTLDSLQHLTNLVVNKDQSDKVKIRIDSENYRDKRFKTLESLAKSVANNVIKTKKDYELEPMSSYERRIIHSILQKERNIETESIGEERERRVVVRYRRY